MNERWNVGGTEVEVTHADRVLFPGDGITKGDLAAYYRDAAGFMLPHISGRPLHMQRFPRGIGEEGFVQKEAHDNAPDWVRRVTVEKEGGHVTHVVADNPATLVYLANLASITPHVWQSRTDRLDCPDRLILDLDPPEDDFSIVSNAAKLLRKLLDELGMPSFLMSTGSRGLHVVIPLKPEKEFDDVRGLAQEIGGELVRRDPDCLTMEMRKEDRRGRLFVDTLRNSYGATAVAPYSIRAREGAPVATPLHWDELDDNRLTARSFTLRTFPTRLAAHGDIWKDLESHAASLAGTRGLLGSIRAR